MAYGQRELGRCNIRKISYKYSFVIFLITILCKQITKMEYYRDGRIYIRMYIHTYIYHVYKYLSIFHLCFLNINRVIVSGRGVCSTSEISLYRAVDSSAY